MVSSVNSHTNATRIGWHLWEIDLRFAPGLPPGWMPCSCRRGRDLLEIISGVQQGDSYSEPLTTLAVSQGCRAHYRMLRLCLRGGPCRRLVPPVLELWWLLLLLPSRGPHIRDQPSSESQKISAARNKSFNHRAEIFRALAGGGDGRGREAAGVRNPPHARCPRAASAAGGTIPALSVALPQAMRL